VEGPEGAAPDPTQAPPEGERGEHRCRNCRAEMAPGQDWCLQCGAGAPGSLGSSSWRWAAAIMGVVAILVLGAAAAGYAALTAHRSRSRVVIDSVAPPAAAVPATPPAASAVPPAAKVAPATTKPLRTPSKLVAPKTVVKVPITPIKTTPTSTTKTTTTPSSSNTGGTGVEESTPTAIVLDSNAASTYNPNGYPASNFGDPSLAIDGESSTGWTARVEPTLAPKVQAGLVLDLRAPQKLGAVELLTTTPGMAIQIFGANGDAPPGAITDAGWVKLTGSLVVKKNTEHLALKESTHAFTYVLVWISRAKSGSPAPSRVTLNEVELFPAG